MKTVETDLGYFSYIETYPNFTGCVIDCDGDKVWYLNGECHRTDGPAYECADGSKYWFLNGKSLTEEEWKSSVSSTCNETKQHIINPSNSKETNMKTVKTKLTCTKYIEKHPNFTGCIIDCDGYKIWYLNGKCHRTDGPAIEWANGTKEWWLNGELHRTDGPAFEGVDGTKLWYLNGELHREDVPAAEFAEGSKYWYLNGKRHREDGPAAEFADGSKLWFLNGNRLTEEEWVCTIRLNKLGEFLNENS